MLERLDLNSQNRDLTSRDFNFSHLHFKENDISQLRKSLQLKSSTNNQFFEHSVKSQYVWINNTERKTMWTVVDKLSASYSFEVVGEISEWQPTGNSAEDILTDWKWRVVARNIPLTKSNFYHRKRQQWRRWKKLNLKLAVLLALYPGDFVFTEDLER